MLKKTRNGATLKPTERLAVSDVFSVKVLSSQVCALMKVFLFLLSKAKYLIFKNVFFKVDFPPAIRISLLIKLADVE